MNYTKFQISVVISLCCLMCNVHTVFSQTEDELLKKKIDFILLAASKIYLPGNDSSKAFRIGIYGKQTSVNALFKELHSRSPEITIRNKPVEVHYFRKVRNIVPVDVFM